APQSGRIKSNFRPTASAQLKSGFSLPLISRSRDVIAWDLRHGDRRAERRPRPRGAHGVERGSLPCARSPPPILLLSPCLGVRSCTAVEVHITGLVGPFTLLA